MNQTWKTVVGVLSLVFIPGAAALRAQEVSPSDVALGERFYELSQRVLPSATTQPTAPYQYQQCAAMLKAAAKVNPAEPRYPRLLADALLQLGDEAGEIEAMKAYRKLRPGDQGAQLQLINLYVEQIETLQDRVKYLTDISGRDTVPAEVRSAVASRCADLFMEKGDEVQTLAWVNKAIALNPLNGRALKLKYDLTRSKATPGQRVAMLLARLRANPSQYPLVVEVARELSMQGMVSQSILWYSLGDKLAILSQIPVPYDAGLNYASELVLASKSAEAKLILDQMVAGNPADYAALVLRIVTEKHQPKPDEELIGKLKTQTWNALVRRLAVVRGEKPAEATTRPTDEPRLQAPDLSGAAATTQPVDEQKKAELRQAVEDLAWFAVYMDRQGEVAQKLMAQIAPLVQPTDAVATRIAGWVFLTQEKKDEARVKLSAVADKDALAALGLVRLTQNPEQAKAEGQKLLNRQPAGVLGAVLWDGLTDAKLGCRVMPNADAGSVIDALEKFPKGWINVDKEAEKNILVSPQTFYVLRCEPLKIVHRYGEPIIARVTIRNVSEKDITVGPDGTIQPMALIEVLPQGEMRQSVGPVRIFERLTEQLVLRPRQSVSVTTRLDQQELAQGLDNRPIPAITLSGNVRTNTLADGRPGPAGEGMNFSKPIERGPFPVTTPSLEKLGAEVAQGKDRISAMELAARLSQLAGAGEAEKTQGQALAEKIRAARNDPDGSVRAWAACFSALLAPPAEKPKELQAMAEDKDWRVQFLAMVAMQELPPEQQKGLLKQLQEKAGEPVVRELAAADLSALEAKATTRPAGGAATQP